LISHRLGAPIVDTICAAMQVVEAPAQTVQTSKASTRIAWIALWLAVVTGVVLRTLRLGRESLWFDEGYTAWMVSHSPREIIRLILADTAPPLYYLIVHFWTQIFGDSEAALRSFSAVCSLLTLLLGIGIARRMLRNPAAVVAAAWLMALSFLQVWYAREARAYALMGLLGVASFDILQRHLASHHRRWLIALVLVIATEMYTHNMMAPYALAVMLAWLILPSDHPFRRRIVEIILVIAASFVLYLPWALLGLPAQMEMIRRAFWVDPLKPGIFFDAIVNLVGVKHYWSWENLLDRIHLPIGRGARAPSIVGGLMIASAFLSIFRQSGLRRREAIGLLTMALFPLLFVAAYSVLRTPLFTAKLFLPSTTLMCIFIVIPLAMPLSRNLRLGAWACTILLIALSALTLYGHNLEDPKENWRALAQIVSQLPQEHRLIVFVANDGELPFDYYYRYRPDEARTGTPSGFFDLAPPRTMRQVFTPSDLAPLENELATGQYQQIVLVLAHEGWADHQHLTQSLLQQRYTLAGSQQLADVAVQWYDVPH
jgi:4-amino-4-deoxy-L-arabinose transferase-like glycosyltransferase